MLQELLSRFSLVYGNLNAVCSKDHVVISMYFEIVSINLVGDSLYSVVFIMK